MKKTALKAAKILEEQGLCATVINALTVHPIDTKTITENTGKYLFTIEDNLINGGFGQSVKAECDFRKYVTVKNYGWDDLFIEHGKSAILYEKHMLDAKNIADDILKTVKGENKN